MWYDSAGHTTPERAFAVFFHRHFADCCNFAWRFTHDMEAAKDLVMECLERVWDKQAKFSTGDELKAYLYVSVRNACWHHVEVQKRTHRNVIDIKNSLPSETQDITHQLIRVETFHELRLALETLPPQCRRVFKKLYVEGKTLRETAAELKLSLSTVKNQRIRGLKLLRTRLRPYLFFYFLDLLAILSIFSL